MRTLMVVVALGLPIGAAAVDRGLVDRPAGGAPTDTALTATASQPQAAPRAIAPARDAVVSNPLSAPQVRSSNDGGGVWSGLQAVPTRAALTAPVQTASGSSRPPERLPRSGTQWYALIAAGIAAVGFMASRRTRG